MEKEIAYSLKIRHGRGGITRGVLAFHTKESVPVNPTDGVLNSTLAAYVERKPFGAIIGRF